MTHHEATQPDNKEIESHSTNTVQMYFLVPTAVKLPFEKKIKSKIKTACAPILCNSYLRSSFIFNYGCMFTHKIYFVSKYKFLIK